MKGESILHPRLTGVIKLSGRHGIGKTTLAAMAENPANVLFIDFDDKGEAMHDALQFGQYINANTAIFATGKKGLGQYSVEQDFAHFAKIIDDIPAGQFTVAIIDNISPLEAVFGAEAKKNPAALGLNAANVAAGRFGGEKPGIKTLTARLITSLQAKGIKTIFVICHVGAVWASGVPMPNKWGSKGNSDLDRMAVLDLMLIPSENSVAPAALVLKEAMGKPKFEGGQFKPAQRVMPLRIPVADWPHICAYFDTPANFANPAPGETPSRAETDAYNKDLSEGQMQWVSAAIKAAGNGFNLMADESTAPSPKQPDQVAQPPKQDWNEVWVKVNGRKDKAEIRAKVAKLQADNKTPAEVIAELSL